MGRLLADGRLHRGHPRDARPGRTPEVRPPWLATVAIAALAAVSVASCGGDDREATSTFPGGDAGTTASVPQTDTTAAGGGPEVTTEPGPHTCDTIDEDLVRYALQSVGEVSGALPSGFDGLATTFSRADGTEFAYVPTGCRYIVTTDTGEEHRVTLSSAADPDGIDLYEEMGSVVADADREPVDGVGDGAFIDKQLDDRAVTLVARTGERVLFVKSQPPPGGAVLDDPTLVLLAGIALLVDPAPATAG